MQCSQYCTVWFGASFASAVESFWVGRSKIMEKLALIWSALASNDVFRTSNNNPPGKIFFPWCLEVLLGSSVVLPLYVFVVEYDGMFKEWQEVERKE